MEVVGYALAALVGISLGMLGGGGSLFTVAIFVYVLGYDPKLAIIMSLPVIGITSLVGAINHWRVGHASIRTAVTFGAIAMLGAFFGARAAALISGAVQLATLATLMMVAALLMLRSAKKVVPTSESFATKPASRHLAQLIPVARVVGFLTGIVGIGGGFLVVPSLVLLAGISMKEAVGTSLLVIAMNAAAAFAGYAGQASVPWPFITLFTTIAVAGILLGSYLLKFVEQTALKRAFAVFLLFMSGFMFYKNRAVFAHFSNCASEPCQTR